MRCVNVAFFPFNAESYSFSGNLYIAIDHHYAIKRADLQIPGNLNINFLENLRIVQHYNLLDNSFWVKEKEDMYANFKMTDFLTKVYAHQVRSYRDFDLQKEPHFASDIAMISVEKSDDFWENNRHLILKKAESDLPKLMTELQNVAWYRRFEKFLEIVITGYIKTANESQTKSKIDLGPIYSVYGKNPIEGHRLRSGLMTTAHLHPQIFFSGYAAYGFLDKKWKYSATTTYSFLKKENYRNEFPRNDISFSAEHDLYSLGMQMNDAMKDNLFVALGTQGIANRSYQNRYKLSYTVDHHSGFGISAWLRHTKDTPAGALEYWQETEADVWDKIPHFSLSHIGLNISYSPGMTDFGKNRDGQNAKINFINDNIRFNIWHEYAIKGFGGGNYSYHQTQIAATDRFWLSSFGHIDFHFSGGKVWNKVPFPMLASPRVNPSIFIERNHFHMMQPFEFVADEYLALHTNYYLKGWLLNRIPVLRKLQLREVISFSGYFGNLTDKNNPETTLGLFRFPESANAMKGELYCEGSIGIENIFKVFRIDYFRRFTHLDYPEAKRNGVRIGFRFAF